MAGPIVRRSMLRENRGAARSSRRARHPGQTPPARPPALLSIRLSRKRPACRRCAVPPRSSSRPIHFPVSALHGCAFLLPSLLSRLDFGGRLGVPDGNRRRGSNDFVRQRVTESAMLPHWETPLTGARENPRVLGGIGLPRERLKPPYSIREAGERIGANPTRMA